MNLSTFSVALSHLLAVPQLSTSFTSLSPLLRQKQPSHTQILPPRSTPRPLFGILDEINSDAFQLGKDEKSSPDVSKAYDMFLGELVFSPNDPRVDIIENADKAFDPSFLAWLENKIKTTRDVEEKIALKDLLEMISDLKEKMELSQAAAEREERERAERERQLLEQREREIEEGKRLSNTEVLKRASQVDTAAVDQQLSAKASADSTPQRSFYERDLTPEIRESYSKLLKTLLPPYPPGVSAKSVVFNEYDRFDAQLLKVLDERRSQGDNGAAELLEALAVEQQKRVTAATEAVKTVLSAGDPRRMEGAIVSAAREGRIDETFLLLLEANADQAAKAGANEAARVMRQLRKRAIEEKDKKSVSKEVALLRKLLRAEDAQAREELLTDAFTPKDNLLVPGTAENARKAVDGEQPEAEKPLPEVPPPDFINACKAVLLNFGNLDDGKGDMSSRIKQIASEAEVVATRIYGKGMTTREQQDRMWKEETTSIFDLERMEIEAERFGEKAPWANKDINDEILPGFDADGRMSIGGS